MPRQPIDCPICGVRMLKRVVLDGLELDYCDTHGVWLDSGEMERLFAAHGGGSAPRASGGVGRSIAQSLGGAAVMGSGFHLGSRLVGGILDAMFNRRG
jgi:hypothetical protein